VISWLAKRLLSRNMAKLRGGDYRPLLRGDAQDVRFRFPGDSSFATELQGKDALEQWLKRFVDIGLQIYPDEVLLKGPPWRSTLCVRGTVYLDDASGKRVYDNRYVIWGRMVWASSVSTRSTRTPRRPPPSTITWPRANKRRVQLLSDLALTTLPLEVRTTITSEKVGWREELPLLLTRPRSAAASSFADR
jgi:hypothetical protein